MTAPKTKIGELDALVRALWGVFESPNEVDSNLEPANVVDALYVHARATHRHAEAIERHAEAIGRLAASIVAVSS